MLFGSRVRVMDAIVKGGSASKVEGPSSVS
jgi:hypothetical protein